MGCRLTPALPWKPDWPNPVEMRHREGALSRRGFAAQTCLPGLIPEKPRGIYEKRLLLAWWQTGHVIPDTLAIVSE